jgi:hypothetical protein
VYIRTIDIAHPPLKADAAEEALDAEMRQVTASAALRVLKVIHGYGSSERPGILKEIVRNWTFRRKKFIRAAIPGETYDLFQPDTAEMRRVCGQEPDSDLGTGNPGITIVWIK